MAVIYDPILNKLRKKDAIPQLDADPASPKAEDAWVLKTSTGGGAEGEPIGLLLALTYSGSADASTYTLSYRTKESTTVRVALT